VEADAEANQVYSRLSRTGAQRFCEKKGTKKDRLAHPAVIFVRAKATPWCLQCGPFGYKLAPLDRR